MCGVYDIKKCNLIFLLIFRERLFENYKFKQSNI